MAAGERLDGKMDPLMPLQIVVPIEALRTLIALERPIVWWRLMLRWVMRVRWRCAVVHVLQVGGMSAVKAKRHAVRQRTVDKLHLTVRILHVREHWAWKRILMAAERTLIGVRRGGGHGRDGADGCGRRHACHCTTRTHRGLLSRRWS